MGYEVVNLGSDQPAVLIDTIRLVEQKLEGKTILDYQPRHAADVPATWADISKARQLLGWQPEMPLEEGIQRLVDWYLENEEWAANISTN